MSDSKKNILLVVRWPVGGIRTFMRYVYRNSDLSKWSFTIIAPEYDDFSALLDDLSGLNFEYVPIRDMPRDGSSGFVKMSFCVASQLMKKKYSLVHSHGFTSAMCMALPAFLFRTPHLMTAHETLNDRQFFGFKGWLRQCGMAVLFGLIDKIHSVSYDAQENLFAYFPSLGGNGGKCVVVRNGIEVERFLEAEPRDFRSEFGLGDNVFLIGFMGRFMAPKGFRYLVDAVEILLNEGNLPKDPLVLTFGAGGFAREEWQNIQKRGLEGHFRFLPFTPNVAGAIKGVDVVAVPSLWEACPLLPMEALVCGTPVVGSDCIGLREVLRGTPAKVFLRADAYGLATKLREEMVSSTKDISLRFSDFAAVNYDVKQASRSIFGIYDEMINSHV